MIWLEILRNTPPIAQEEIYSNSQYTKLYTLTACWHTKTCPVPRGLRSSIWAKLDKMSSTGIYDTSARSIYEWGL
jgi:hypothetical protein